MSTMMTPGQLIYNLGPLDRLPPGEGRTFRLGETSVAVFRTRQDEVFGMQATCSHKGGPLADGIIGDGKIVCPLHAFKFTLVSGASVGGTCEALKTYPVSLNERGEILLTLTA